MGGKTRKTWVLPGFYDIEQAAATEAVLPAKNLPWWPCKKSVNTGKVARMLSMTATLNTVSGHDWQHSRNLSTMLLNSSLSWAGLPNSTVCQS